MYLYFYRTDLHTHLLSAGDEGLKKNYNHFIKSTLYRLETRTRLGGSRWLISSCEQTPRKMEVPAPHLTRKENVSGPPVGYLPHTNTHTPRIKAVQLISMRLLLKAFNIRTERLN